MKIAVLSDTHSGPLPESIISILKKVDLIIHAGDICTKSDLQNLQKLNKVEAVCGNMDDSSIRGVLPLKKIIPVGQKKIGLFHGRGPSRKVLDVVKEQFKRDKVDAVIFGHSHVPYNTVINNVLYFNPGCANHCLCFEAPCSYGLLDVSDAGIEGEIVEI
ncbi:MAG: metallophosphatase family protein [Candidatus Omnitrophica bacterium]|nr:metallophosphatase family protein [Candidatus Omnitrophota bacterium]